MNELKEEFRELRPKYIRLASGVTDALKQFLDNDDIPFFDVENRVKDEESFLEKVSRKSYDKPLEEVEDISGIRIICYYKEDLDLIDSIIKNQFTVLSQSIKYEEMATDQFGYASNHYVISIKPSWMETPNYSGLEGLKAEIQVRTILMHAWAAISHKLLYKREEDVPKQFKRKLNRLSALIELADEQFDDFRNLKDSYKNTAVLDENITINADSFLLLMSKYFENRKIADETDVMNVLQEVRKYSGGIKDFEERIKRCLPILEDMENEELVLTDFPMENELPLWGLSGVARTILDLTADEYFKARQLPERIVVIRNKYREKI